MDADDAVGRGAGNGRGDHRAGVAALDAEALVAETRHQFEQGRGDAAVIPAGFARRAGKAKAGERGDYEIEAGSGKRGDDVEEFDEGAGPAVQQEERRRVRRAGLDVEEMDGLAVDLGQELRVLVDPGLGGAPVKAIAQALDHGGDESGGGTGAPAGAGDFAGEHGIGEALL